MYAPTERNACWDFCQLTDVIPIKSTPAGVQIPASAIPVAFDHFYGDGDTKYASHTLAPSMLVILLLRLKIAWQNTYLEKTTVFFLREQLYRMRN